MPNPGVFYTAIKSLKQGLHRTKTDAILEEEED